MKYLGIDFGLKKIGLAIGDSQTRIAMPLEVLKVTKVIEAIEVIKDLIADEGIDEVIIGLPKSAGDFHDSEQLELTKKFIQKLEETANIPVHSVDESYSSVESQRIQKEEGSDIPEDILAAMLILQSYFDETKSKE